MAKASTTEHFNCSAQTLYDIITDYDRYEEFLSEIKSCKVIDESGGKKLVEYKVSVVKSFTYKMWMTEDPGNTTVNWEFDSGDLFRKSVGSWVIEDTEDGCQATYSVEAKMKMFVPGTITKMLVNVNLPGMMKAYKDRIKQLEE